MAAGSVSITITVPSLNGAGAGTTGAGASNLLADTLIQQAAQQIAASGATSGNIIYPPGSATVAGTWTYSPAT